MHIRIWSFEYPDELHELHNYYPLAPEKFQISHSMLSKYCSSTADKYDIKIGSVKKLVRNLGSKLCPSLQKSSAIFVIWNEIS